MKPHELMGMAEISCFAGDEIDDGILGRNTEGYDCSKRTADYLLQRVRESQEGEFHDPLASALSEFISLQTFYKPFGFEITDNESLREEMRFVALELRHVEELPERRRRELMTLCIELSSQFGYEQNRSSLPSYLAA